jgi:ferrous iron transport protein B
MVGQPNSGKSTIFNAVAGYKSVSSNFPGTTVKYEKSTIQQNGSVFELIDFPGSYSLSSENEAELEIREYILSKNINVIINIIDASRLGRGLAFTLELIELGIPMVLCLNMMDEASRKGISIDTKKLSELIGIPVVSTVALKDIGIKELFEAAKQAAGPKEFLKKKQLLCQKDVENVINQLTDIIDNDTTSKIKVSSRFIALKLLEADKYFIKKNGSPNTILIIEKAKKLRQELARLRGKSADTVIAMERNALAMEIFRKVSEEGKPRKDWRDKIDDLLMHNVLGYLFMAISFVGIFYLVFGLGALLEKPLLQGFNQVEIYFAEKLSNEGFLFTIVKSILFGLSGGLAIVLPYLVPFLIILTILEDIGYLPRIAYLMDSFMHRIGLHGTSILPVVLGYGCSVPAVMATRILPTKRDKIINAVIATLVPCSARSVVIFGLVAYYLGAGAALFIYILNIIIVAIVGKVFSVLMPSVSPGMIMEMPRYQWPTLHGIFQKVWFRIREFVIIAWPLLIVGSIILGIIEYLNWADMINSIFSPLTMLLGLPVAVGITLVFGVLRKELTLIMLMQALGTTQVLSVMTPTQIMVFTIFITFYIPCVATIAMIINELGVRWTFGIAGFTLLLATCLAFLFKTVMTLI